MTILNQPIYYIQTQNNPLTGDEKHYFKAWQGCQEIESPIGLNVFSLRVL